MNTSNSLLGLLVHKTSACIWLIKFPRFSAVFSIVHLFFLLPLLCVLNTDHTVTELALLRKLPECFNQLLLATALFFHILSGL
jgi:hypothetical protein